MTKLAVLDLFSGIGGFSLGLERTGGFETKAFCEISPFCRRVLAKHWPNVPCFEDVTTLRGEDVGPVDAICGGFPCQDVSLAGKRGGLDAARSGLWAEYDRLIGELEPSLVLVENTPGLLSLGMGRVLGDLAARGYDAQWDCIPANRLGAPHERDRVWIVAYPNEERLQERVHVSGVGAAKAAPEQPRGTPDRVSPSSQPSNAHARQQSLGRALGRMGRLFQPVPWHRAWPIASEPVLDRGADGIPYRLDRVGALGNAVVPQIPELIGRAILEARAAA
jgi:DNA (cytosine-5)-methyltransferase 1